MIKKTKRPYRLPGGIVTAWIATILCFLFILLCLLLFIFPDIFSGSVDWATSAPILIGLVVILIFGECLIRFAERGSDIKDLK